MDIDVRARVIEWRGPAPFVFLPLPADVAADVAEIAPVLTYGWGVVPVRVTVGRSSWTTSLFPKDGGYLVPLRAAERRRERIEVGDTVDAVLTFGSP